MEINQEEPTQERHQDQPTSHDRLTVPQGITPEEFAGLLPSITQFHAYALNPYQCSSLLAQRVRAPLSAVWALLRRFDNPQAYKHFIKSCSVPPDFTIAAGATRDVTVITGLPATTSRERLDVVDDERHVTGFTIVGGEHRLRNYRSVTTAHEVAGDDPVTLVLESYVVDVPEGNTEEDTRLFADTVVKLNLQNLAAVAEGIARDDSAKSHGQ